MGSPQPVDDRLVVLVTMVSMYFGLAVAQRADTMKGYWYDRVQVSIYLRDHCSTRCSSGGATEEQKDTLRTRQALPVKQVFFESRRSLSAVPGAVPQQPAGREHRGRRHPRVVRVQLEDPSSSPSSSPSSGAPGVRPSRPERVLNRFFTVINYITSSPSCSGGTHGLRGRAAHGDDDPTIGLQQTSRDRHHAARGNFTIRLPFVIERSSPPSSVPARLRCSSRRSTSSTGSQPVVLDQALIGDWTSSPSPTDAPRARPWRSSPRRSRSGAICGSDLPAVAVR